MDDDDDDDDDDKGDDDDNDEEAKAITMSDNHDGGDDNDADDNDEVEDEDRIDTGNNKFKQITTATSTTEIGSKKAQNKRSVHALNVNVKTCLVA